MVKKIVIIYIFLVVSLLTSCSREATEPLQTSSPEVSQHNDPSLDKNTSTPNSSSEVVEFYDKGLEKIIREKLNKPEEPIFTTELEGITELYAWADQTSPEEDYSPVSYPRKDYSEGTRGNIGSLKDMVHLKNLKHLTMVQQNIDDFSPLSELQNLESLDIACNGIDDFSFLKNLKKLKSLNILANNLSELSQVTHLQNLEMLDISYNKIDDIKGIEKLPYLKALMIDQVWSDYKTRITDLSPLKGMRHLETLSLSSNSIEDLSPLSGLILIRELDLCNNEIENIAPLSKLVNMDSLDLDWNGIYDIQPLTNMKKLRKLRIDYYGVMNPSLLRQFPGLTDVEFDWSKVPYAYTISPQLAQEGVAPGNHANNSSVGFDGSSLYFIETSYGDLPHPVLVRLDLQTEICRSISGQITEQMHRVSGAATGGWINEEVSSLNIYKGKLYFYSYGHNNSEASCEEWGYYPGGDLQGFTRMNLDGSHREYLTTEPISDINIKNNKIYYLDGKSLPSRMDLDGSHPEVLVNKPCRFVYATDERLFYIPLEDSHGLFAMSLEDLTEEVIISEKVSSPIILNEAIYFLNTKGNICKYDYDAGHVEVIKECSASKININYRYIFFADDERIYRMDHDGSNLTTIREDWAWDLSVIGDYVFYQCGDGLKKIKDDGSEYTEYFTYY